MAEPGAKPPDAGSRGEPIPPAGGPRPEERRQRDVLVNVLRAVLIILLFVVTALGIVTESADATLQLQLVENWWAWALATLGFFALIVGIDVLTPRRKLSTISALILGSFAGLLATVIVGFVIDLFVETYLIDELRPQADQIVLAVKVIVGLGMIYLGITTVLQTQDDFRLVIPYVEFVKQYRGARPLLLDTSALVDGRIADAAETGLFSAPMLVPRFVVDELHALADSGERVKRERGRRGLELLARLQRSPLADVTIEDRSVGGTRGVDQALVELARVLPATLVTTDAGLVRVARVREVGVVNLHDVANAFKQSLVPGEPVRLELIKRGEQAGQAVGFLDDGAMVVVENGGGRLGEVVDATVTSAMQTSAGRLIFARLASGGVAADDAADDRATDRSVGDSPEPSAVGGAVDNLSPDPTTRETPDVDGPSVGEPSRTTPIGPRRGDVSGAPSPRNPRRG
mgnify:FL=1